jgi:Protein of unknown function (DUF1810)
LGGIDARKLRSSMTVFAHASPDDSTFAAVLDRFFDGNPDPATLGLLRVGGDDQVPTGPAGPQDQPAGKGSVNPA